MEDPVSRVLHELRWVGSAWMCQTCPYFTRSRDEAEEARYKRCPGWT
jgi:hypothetical protein